MERYYNVLLDTSIVLVPFELKIDIGEEIKKLLMKQVKFAVLEPVLNEIKHKKQGIGVKILEKLNVSVIAYNKRVADDAIVEYATEHKNVIVATNDVELKQRLRKRNVPVIYVRGKSTVKLDGYVR